MSPVGGHLGSALAGLGDRRGRDRRIGDRRIGGDARANDRRMGDRRRGDRRAGFARPATAATDRLDGLNEPSNHVQAGDVAHVSKPVDGLLADAGHAGDLGDRDLPKHVGELLLGDHVQQHTTKMSNQQAGRLVNLDSAPRDNQSVTSDADSSTRNILAKNLRRLIDSEGVSIRAWALKRGLDVRFVDRLTKGEHAITLGKLEEVASAIGCQPWQLLVPGLDPSAMPDAPITAEERQMLSRLRKLLDSE